MPSVTKSVKRKRNGGQPRSSADPFEGTFHQAGVGIAHVDTVGRFVRANRKFAQILGYSAEELLHLTFLQLSAPGTAANDLIALQEILKGSRETFSSEKRYQRKDGSHVWCNMTVSLLDAPDLSESCFVAVLQDVSARKQAEEELARSNEMLALSQTAGCTGSFEWSIADDTVTWSDAHIKMLGLWPAPLTGSADAWRKCVLPDDLQRVDAEFRAALAQRREDCSTEYRIQRADTAEERWLASRGRISYNSRGRALMMVGVSVDTTDRQHPAVDPSHHGETLEQHVQRRTSDLVDKTLEMSEQSRQLDQANESLRQLSARILHLQDEERRRISRHLHDSTGSWIAALSMNFGVLNTEATQLSTRAKTILSDSQDILREMSDDLRTVSHLLHPPLLDEMGLQSALRWFTEEFSTRSKIPVVVEIAPHLGRLSRECETAIFRVVQEALTNVHRHSSSPRASICLTSAHQEVALEVRDWGTGISLGGNGTHARSGVGLQGMRERIRLLGGEFEIRRNPEGGTSVIAKFAEKSVCLSSTC